MSAESLTFRSKKDASFGILLVILILIITGVGFVLPYRKAEEEELSQLIISSVITFIFIILIFWIWFNTKYTFLNEHLRIYSGPFFLNIRVTEINTIRLNQQTIGGMFKFTRSWKCIEITHKSTRRIYISPVKEPEFLDQLLKINPNIAVIHR